MNTIKNSKLKLVVVSLLLLTTATLFSCKKDQHTPPIITFKSGAGYTSSNATVSTGEDILFGVSVEKTEDELSTFDVSVSVNGGTAMSIPGYPETISGSDQDGFARDIQVTTGGTAQTEKYTFTVTDRDGNITQEFIILTVQ